MASATTKPSWMGDYSIGQVSSAIGRQKDLKPSKAKSALTKVLNKKTGNDSKSKKRTGGAEGDVSKPKKKRTGGGQGGAEVDASKPKKKRTGSGQGGAKVDNASKPKKKRTGDGGAEVDGSKPKKKRTGGGQGGADGDASKPKKKKTWGAEARMKKKKSKEEAPGKEDGGASVSIKKTQIGKAGSKHITFGDDDIKPKTQSKPKGSNGKTKLDRKQNNEEASKKMDSQTGPSKKHVYFGDDDGGEDLFPRAPKKAKKSNEGVVSKDGDKGDDEKRKFKVKRNRKKGKGKDKTEDDTSNATEAEAVSAAVGSKKESSVASQEKSKKVLTDCQAARVARRLAAKKLKKKIIWKAKKKAKKEGRIYEAPKGSKVEDDASERKGFMNESASAHSKANSQDVNTPATGKKRSKGNSEYFKKPKRENIDRLG